MTSLQAEGDHNLGEVETGKKVNGSQKKEQKNENIWGEKLKLGKPLAPGIQLRQELWKNGDVF